MYKMAYGYANRTSSLNKYIHAYLFFFMVGGGMFNVKNIE